jgi:hypothetical protein
MSKCEECFTQSEADAYMIGDDAYQKYKHSQVMAKLWHEVKKGAPQIIYDIFVMIMDFDVISDGTGKEQPSIGLERLSINNCIPFDRLRIRHPGFNVFGSDNDGVSDI